jgi:hypothetical protein
MTLARNMPAKSVLSTRHWMLIGAALIALQASTLFAMGAASDLRLRLREILARRGAELGKFAAHHRLVHVLAHHSRFSVLCRDLARAAAPRMARPSDIGHVDRRRLGDR